MTEGGSNRVLISLLAEQRDLEERLQHQRGPVETLALGRALLRFAARESAAFQTLAPLLDPAVQRDLATEHRQIADDLDLLAWMVQTTPDSGDVPVLANSLGQRMQHHINRDGRLLSRAVALAQT